MPATQMVVLLVLTQVEAVGVVHLLAPADQALFKLDIYKVILLLMVI